MISLIEWSLIRFLSVSLQVLLFRAIKHETCHFYQCIGFDVLSEELNGWYNIFESMFFFIIPIIFILYLYFCIVMGLYSCAKQKNKDRK